MINKQISSIIALCLLLYGFISCDNNNAIIPKPRMYPKVIFPSNSIRTYTNTNCPFTFEYPAYYNVVKDSSKIAGVKATDKQCWFNLDSEALKMTLHLSYLSIIDRKDLDTHVKDAFTLADEHNIKASFRKEELIEHEENNVTGLLFEIEGDVAAPLQFYVTDSTRHFLRASLYFNTKVNQDSTKIIYDFMRKDVVHLLETIRFR